MNSQGNGKSLNTNKKGQSPVAIFPSSHSKSTATKNNPVRPLGSSTQIKRPNEQNMAQIEEGINITVPTPYPRAQFMTIDDPVLQNSEYTNALNEKYPPRKYLKHNQQSWNKIVKPKSSDIKFSFMNPKLKFSDYNLKRLMFKNEEIGEAKLTNLEDAQELVDKLKAKLIEYELTNNSNIEHANEMVNNYKELIEAYKKKLSDLYDKFAYIERKYGIDLDYLNEDDPYNIMTKGFRRRWLIRNFMNAFVGRITRQKLIKYRYNEYRDKMDILLKLKGFISLEKNHTMSAFSKTIVARHEIQTLKNIFSSFQFNKYINKISRQFALVQRNMVQLLYFKELKLRVYQRKNYKTKNYKALLLYYRKGVGKALRALHKNCIRKSIQIQSNKVNYTKFASSLGKLNKAEKEMKIQGMSMMKNLIDRMTEVSQNKISNVKNKTIVLIHYFREWRKGSKENALILDYNILMKQHMIQSFFRTALKARRLYRYDLVSSNKNVKKANAKVFFDTVKHILSLKEKSLRIKLTQPLNVKRHFITKLQNLVIDSPYLHFKRIKRRILYGDFIDSLRNYIKFTKSSGAISVSKDNYIHRIPIIYRRMFFIHAKKKIIPNKRKAKKIRSIFSRSIMSKALHALLVKSYACKQFELRNYYENTISNIKTILTEKSGMINKLEYDNKDLASHFDEGQTHIQSISVENKMLRQTLYDQQYKYENELRRYQELMDQNANDVKSLQMTIQNNENMLSQAIMREEQLQNKYVSDVQNAVKLNKNLNEIIARKNQQLLESNLIKRKEAEEEQIEKQKIYQQNSALYNNLTYAIHQKEYEKVQLNEEKNNQIHHSTVLLEHYQKEKQMVDFKNTQLQKENKMLLSKVNSQGFLQSSSNNPYV